MKKINCPVCEKEIEISDKQKSGGRITCPFCFAQLSFHLHRGKPILACAICKEAVFDPNNCDACERRRDKRALLEEGRL